MRSDRARFIAAASLLLAMLSLAGCWETGGDTRADAGPFPVDIHGDARDIAQDIDETPDVTTEVDSDGTTPDAHAQRARCLLIDSTDWITAGSLSVLDLDTGAIRRDLTTYHADATIRVLGDEVYVVNRLFADNITRLDPDNDYAVMWQHSVGNGANPHDIVRYGDLGFVSLYGEGKVVEVYMNPGTSGPFLTGREITLPVQDGDGEQADPGRVFVRDGILYVVANGLNERDSFQCEPQSRGRIYAFDADTLEVVDAFANGTRSSFTASACNATDVHRIDGDSIYLRTIGSYRYTGDTGNDGSIERINLDDGRSYGRPLDEQAAGNADIFVLEFVNDDLAWGVFAGDDFYAIDLRPIDTSDPDAWTVGDSVHTGYMFDVFADDDVLYVSERDPSSKALLKLDAATGEPLPDSPINTPVPPDELVYFERDGDSCW